MKYLAQFGYYQGEMQRYVLVDVADDIIQNIQVLDQIIETPETFFLNGILTNSMIGKTMERIHISPFSTIDYLLELLTETTQELRVGDNANLLLWDFVPSSSGILNKRVL